MGMGYGMGYAQPSFPSGGGYSQSQMPVKSMQSVGSPIDKAPVCCNCCNCTHYGCAKFWVIYNSIQLVLCYIFLITEAAIGLGPGRATKAKKGTPNDPLTYPGSSGVSQEELLSNMCNINSISKIDKKKSA